MTNSELKEMKWKRIVLEVLSLLIIASGLVFVQFSKFKGIMPLLVCTSFGIIILSLVFEKKDELSKRGKIINKYALFALICIFILMNDESGKPCKVTFLNESDDKINAIVLDESCVIDGKSPYIASEKYLLHKGTYHINITYLADESGTTVELYEDGRYIDTFNLWPCNKEQDISFELKEDAHNVQIKLMYCGKGNLQIENCVLSTDNVIGFYSDNLFFLFVFVALSLFISIVENINYRFDKQSIGLLFVFILATVYVSHPMYSTNLTDVDDIMYHMLRIEGVKDGMLDGQFPVIIMPKALQGNGYLNCMYPYLFLYIPAVLRIFNVSLVLSYKVLVFAANFATIAITYYSIKSVKNSKYVALLGALLYLMMPYRYFCLYQRGALGEVLAMTFMPLLLAGLYHVLVGDKDKWGLLVWGFSGLIQSHVLSFVLFLTIMGVCSLIYVKELFVEKRIGCVIKAAVVSIGLNLWFIVPFLTHLIRDNLQIKALRISSFTEDAINPSLFTMTVNVDSKYYLSYGIPILICIAACIVYLLFIKDKGGNKKRDALFSILFTIACIMSLFITGYSASEKFMEMKLFRKAFEMIQFPWRLLAPTSIIFLFIGIVWLFECDFTKNKNIKYAIGIGLIGINLLTVINYQPISRYAYTNDNIDYSIGHETKIKGYVREKVYIGYPLEWRVNGVGNSRILTEMKTSSGDVKVKSYEKNNTDIEFIYSVDGEGEYAVFPLMSYYGYHVIDENREKIEYELANEYAFQVPLNGDSKEHSIRIYYKAPWVYSISAIISFVSVIYWGYYLACCSKRKKIIED